MLKNCTTLAKTENLKVDFRSVPNNRPGTVCEDVCPRSVCEDFVPGQFAKILYPDSLRKNIHNSSIVWNILIKVIYTH